MSLISLPLSYTIDTARCRLRAPSVDDIPHIFEATRTPGFNDGMLWEPPASPEDLHKPLADCLQSWAAGECFVFTIDHRPSAQFLGRISIRTTKQPNVWNIGYFLHPKHQKLGYMREAANAIIAFGFNQLAADQVEACHAIWNLASARVLTAVGMTFREYIPEGFQKRGKWIPENRLAIDRTAWLPHEQQVGFQHRATDL